LVFVTAEIGINHNGSTSIAKKLIDVAVNAGCNAVKFQKRNVEKVFYIQDPSCFLLVISLGPSKLFSRFFLEDFQ